ncbi:hypothetical protein HOP52_09050 [Halomonas campisalis]|uniref:Outer membrane protein beta-barrel domain-containing protein n=1 Tax=Billgrantia campisalis TaxID=74661 RepID=A0ABS9P7Z0_9GAMM|nr:hypothetical protein [Halomonas campisalis]MCG6657902.1 hypothetical protein [Halomonas campisalis]MDR5863574.1 hypothetical protein [Halomonas campisalis]
MAFAAPSALADDADATLADTLAQPGELDAPAYSGDNAEMLPLDNGLLLQGNSVSTPDGFTSGFRVVAGYRPLSLPRLDLGAEITYRASDEVPSSYAGENIILNTTSLGGSLIAGLRLGQFGLYAKTGYADWAGNPVSRGDGRQMSTAGTSRIQGFGARLQFNRAVSRLEFEEIDAPSMAHLNLLTASIHFPF